MIYRQTGNRYIPTYDVAKKNIILCIWCNAMCLCGLRFKKHIIFHILYIIVAPLCSAFLKRVDFYKAHRSESEACSDWPAVQCVVIGRIPQACDGNVTPLTVLWCRVPVRRHKNNKTHYKRGICKHQHYHVCICDWRNDKQAVLYTAQNSHLNRQKQKSTSRLWVRSVRLSLQSWNCPTL